MSHIHVMWHLFREWFKFVINPSMAVVEIDDQKIRQIEGRPALLRLNVSKLSRV